MAEPHPLELRIRVVQAYLAGEGTFPQIAERFTVGEASAKRWVWQYERRGHLRPDRKRGGRRSEINGNEIEQIVARLGDANADEITAEYNRGRRGKDRRHVSSIKRALYRLGYAVKKNGSGRWSSSAST